jgi:hypothetical protein
VRRPLGLVSDKGKRPSPIVTFIREGHRKNNFNTSQFVQSKTLQERHVELVKTRMLEEALKKTKTPKTWSPRQKHDDIIADEVTLDESGNRQWQTTIWRMHGPEFAYWEPKNSLEVIAENESRNAIWTSVAGAFAS